MPCTKVNIANAVATSGIVAGTSYEALVLVDLKKAYLSLLGATLNEIGLVFTSERNQRHLDAVLANVVQMASSLDNDNQVIKNAITVLVKMTDVFTFQGFAEFALDRILPIPFVVPSSPSFNGSDAQTALLVRNKKIEQNFLLLLMIRFCLVGKRTCWPSAPSRPQVRSESSRCPWKSTCIHWPSPAEYPRVHSGCPIV